MSEIYSNPSAMEPMMPLAERGRLAELSFEILQESGRLTGQKKSRGSRPLAHGAARGSLPMAAQRARVAVVTQAIQSRGQQKMLV